MNYCVVVQARGKELDYLRADMPDHPVDHAGGEAARTISGPTGLREHRRSPPLGGRQPLR